MDLRRVEALSRFQGVVGLRPAGVARFLPTGSIKFVEYVLGRTEALRRHAHWRWLFALTAFLVSFLLRYALQGALPPGFPYLTFFPAVILTTFFAGLMPGVALGICCGVAAWFFFIEPGSSFQLSEQAVLALTFYFVIIAVDILLIHWMHQALARLQKERLLSAKHAEERDTLFKEMRHRISNNLAVVGAMLNAQKRALPEGDAANALAQASARLHLVARMQRDLYDPERQTLDIASYLETLGPDIIETMDAGHVRYEADVEHVDVDADLALPLGLIATELISNSVEHAFAGKRPGVIRISLRREPALDQDGQCKGMVLSVADDGPGWPADFNPAASQSLGMRIVMSLAQQIDGEFEYRNEGGAVSTLRFCMAPVAA